MIQPAKVAAVALLLLVAPSLAQAHTGGGTIPGFSAGFLHPWGGLDHLLAMFAVGLLAARLGGRALWVVPGAFVSVMALGALLGLSGIHLPGAEYLILASVIVISLPVALASGMPTPLAMLLVAAFAVFHGHAHAGELSVDLGVEAYFAGFVLATALIHTLGVAAGVLAGRSSLGEPALRGVGAAVAAAGCILALTPIL
jgi:urease accessory protein